MLVNFSLSVHYSRITQNLNVNKTSERNVSCRLLMLRTNIRVFFDNINHREVLSENKYLVMSCREEGSQWLSSQQGIRSRTGCLFSCWSFIESYVATIEYVSEWNFMTQDTGLFQQLLWRHVQIP